MKRPRLRAGIRASVAAGAALCLVPLALVAQETESGPGRAVDVRAVVVDREAGRPLEGARIRLSRRNVPESRILTDARGRASFSAVPGRYFLEVERLGYRSARDSISLVAGARVLMTAELAPEALELEAIVVTTTRRGPDHGGFEERRRKGIGSFVSGADAANRMRVSDGLRGVRGVHTVPVPGRSASDVRLRGGCRPTLVIDGMTLPPFAGLVLDDYVSPFEIEAIEVYRGVETPVRFRAGSCGALVVWTRVPEPTPRGVGFPWKPMLITAAGMAALMLVR